MYVYKQLKNNVHLSYVADQWFCSQERAGGSTPDLRYCEYACCLTATFQHLPRSVTGVCDGYVYQIWNA